MSGVNPFGTEAERAMVPNKTVELYHELLLLAYRSPPTPDNSFSLYSMFRNARVFHIPPDLIDVQDLMTPIADLPPTSRRAWLVEYCKSESIRYDPNVLPFDFVFVGWGAAGVRIRDETSLMPTDRFFLGLLLTHNGWVFRVRSHLRPGQRVFDIEEVRRPSGWLSTGSTALYTMRFLDSVHKYTTTVFLPDLAQKRARKKLAQIDIATKIPAPFYEVVLRSRTHRGDVGDVFRADPAFRWDVRGHYRNIVSERRDELSADKAAAWKSRGWLVESLAPNLWRASKRVWVDGYVKGPKEAPYIPSVRVDKGRE